MGMGRYNAKIAKRTKKREAAAADRATRFPVGLQEILAKMNDPPMQ
jgi:uncharacterized protein YjgD (DUF1641 family)